MANSTSQNNLAWNRLDRAHKRVFSVLEAGLKEHGLPNLDVFSALRVLAETPNDLTAKQLETLLLMPQYGVSRMLDRMEKEGLIKRVARKGDQRSKIIQITKKGFGCLSEQTLVYEQSLEAFFSDRAKPGQLSRLADMLALLDSDPQRD